MKKSLFIMLICILSSNSFALNCNKLADIADDNGLLYGTKYNFTVQGEKGFRTYFHSAPTAQCKLKSIFLIPKDSVIAYQEFKNEGQKWLYIMYIDKNGNDTSGWVIAKDFKISSRYSPIQE